MSRSGYSEDYEQWSAIMWRGAVRSAIRGKRGQAFLREMLEALDALPKKRLISYSIVERDLETGYVEVCAIGAVAVRRALDVKGLDPEERELVAARFGIAPALAAEIAYENDEAHYYSETPEHRFLRVRAWVVEQISDGAAQ